MNAPSDRLRIVLASSEAVPYFKTGGLADVVGALAKTLDQMGHEVTLVVPDFFLLRQNPSAGLPEVTATGLHISLDMNGTKVSCEVNWSTLPGSNVRVLLVRQPDYFDRRQLYQELGHGYIDNCERFCFFSRAVMEICRQMVLRPDVIHCNDWQTGLVPALLASQYAGTPGFERTASVMTLHNMAFQGRFWHFDMPLTGMHWRYFNHHQMEAWNDLNLLKTGIAFADQITTVSPTYAKEICTSSGGCGLEGLLQYRQKDLVGILNGIDDTVWNPATDPCLPAHYSVQNPTEGKAECKAFLQKRLGLNLRPDVPLLGMVSRMSDQKGFDLVAGCAERLLSQNLQMAFLGTGDPGHESRLRQLAQHYPGKVATEIGFDESLAHQIEAGADLFLMPSQFEPCGLNQMYSLRYGTVPIVRNIGGLADSVIHFRSEAASLATATGFMFSDYSSDALAQAVENAIQLFHRKESWLRLMKNGMSKDWSWKRSASEYVEVYQRARNRVSGRQTEGRM